MPRKPHRRTIKLEPLPPPMVTRSVSNKCLDNAGKASTAHRIAVGSKAHATAESRNCIRIPLKPKDDGKLASLVAAAFKINCLPQPAKPEATATSNVVKMAPSLTAPASPLKTASPATVASIISPSSKGENKLPKRRKREPIKLPPGAGAKLSAKDLRRLKNRVSATRLRQRSQQLVQSMQDQLEHYRSRCELLETMMSGCNTCASFSTEQLGVIELLPAEFKIKMEVSDEEEFNGDDSTILTEAECIVLHDVLHS